MRFAPIISLVALATVASSWAASKAGIEGVAPIPVGTILPVELETVLSAKGAHAGEVIKARIAQDVPLPDHGKISRRSSLKGSILAARKDDSGTGTSLTLSFQEIENRGQSLSIVTTLRAIATYDSVVAAQLPFAGANQGTPSGWATTMQIGGDVRYGDGGPVQDRNKQTVGKGVLGGGVLVSAQANPSLGCEGGVNGDDHPQALWVFSSDACGVYGLKGLQITEKGNNAPLGEIVLHFEKQDMKLKWGAGMLLRVGAEP
jgi:hypothetical protein